MEENEFQRRALKSALLLVACFISVEANAAEFSFFEPVQPARRVQVMAHRGAQQIAPENTAPALERSIADTVEWVEVDVRLTKDGHHVLVHDAELARTTDGSGQVDARTLDELKALDAGSKFAKRFAGTRILTLDDALKLAKGRVNLALDGKRIDPSTLARAVLDAGMERQVVVFAPLEVLKAVRSASGGERLALMPKWHPADGLEAFGDLKPAAVEIDADAITPERCRAFHQRGIKVQAKVLGDWDRPEVWDRVIAGGADWLQTDRAEEILAHEVHRKVGSNRVKVAHHRGASRYAPENTLPAYEKSIRLGADFVEFDVRTSRDRAFFLLHDGSLNRTMNLRGAIRTHDAAEIGRADAGAWFGLPFVGTPVPTLDAFLETVANRVELYVDAKDIDPASLVSTLRSRNLIEKSVVYQHPDYLVRLRTLEPQLRRMPPLGDPARIDELAERVQPYAFDTKWGILSKSLIDRCHAKGIKVFSDAIGPNETLESYRRAMLDGIDLIQTDHPVLVLRAIELLDASRR